MLFLSFLFYLHVRMPVSVYALCVCRYLRRAEEGLGSPGTGITGGAEQHSVDAWN